MPPQTRYVFLLRYILPIVDLFMINVVYFTSVELTEFYSQAQLIDSNNNHIIVCNLIWLLSTSFFRMYSVLEERKLENIYRATWKSLASHLLLYTIYLMMHKAGHFSPQFMLWFFFLNVIVFTLNRFVGTAMYQNVTKKYTLVRHVAIVGANGTSAKLIEHFDHETNLLFYGCLGGDEIIYFNRDRLIAIGIDEKLAEAAKCGVSDLLITIIPKVMSEVNDLVELADKHGLRVKFIPDLGVHHFGAYNVNYLGSKFPIITLRHEPLQDMDNRFKKRLFDFGFAMLISIFILWWLIPLIAILIKVESKGPIFFFQYRNGRNNNLFKVIKFRTMKVSVSGDQVNQAVKGDKRITKIGSFLRKTSLDEFPQFINVLFGEMSVVGPRPHALEHNVQYNEIINKYNVRHYVKPGITGWAQVHGLRGETKHIIDMENRIKYDIFYLENWSAMLDVKIVFLTVINMIRGEDNAY